VNACYKALYSHHPSTIKPIANAKISARQLTHLARK